MEYNDYLKAKGMFVLMREYIRKGDEFIAALSELLGEEAHDHVQDTAYGYPDDELEDLLKRLEIEVPKEGKDG